MPYWDYRLDYALIDPADSLVFSLEPFEQIRSIKTTLNENNIEISNVFAATTETIFDPYDKTMWVGRKNAYDILEQMHAGILWKLLLYVLIENDLDGNYSE